MGTLSCCLRAGCCYVPHPNDGNVDIHTYDIRTPMENWRTKLSVGALTTTRQLTPSTSERQFPHAPPDYTNSPPDYARIRLWKANACGNLPRSTATNASIGRQRRRTRAVKQSRSLLHRFAECESLHAPHPVVTPKSHHHTTGSPSSGGARLPATHAPNAFP